MTQHKKVCKGVREKPKKGKVAKTAKMDDVAEEDESAAEEGAKEATIDKEEQQEEEHLYCVCRRPDDGRFHLECSGCEEWYHLSCLHLEFGILLYQFEAENLEEWYCPKDSCRQSSAITQAELEEWGGEVVDSKSTLDGTLFKVSWADGTDAVWVDEEKIPNQSLVAFRAKLQFQQAKDTRRKQIEIADEKKKKKKAVRRRKPLPKKNSPKKTEASRSVSPKKDSVQPVRRSRRSRTPTRRLLEETSDTD